MSLPRSSLRSKWWETPLATLGTSVAMIPLGLLFVLAGGYLGSQMFESGLGLAVSLAISLIGTVLLYGGAAATILLAAFWLRLAWLGRANRSENRN